MRTPLFRLRALSRDCSGSIALIAGICLGVMVLSTGVAVDMARAQMVQARLTTALDAAGLAAGSTLTTTDPVPIVTQYFYANYPQGYMGSTVNHVTVTLSADNHTLKLHADATLPTSFLGVISVHTMTLQANSQITRSNRGMELVLVMDNTGSMSDAAGGSVTKLQAAKSAAASLLNIIYGNANTTENLWVGLVPFSQAVNIGTSRTTWLDAADFAAHDFGAKITGTTCSAYNGTNGTYASNPKCTYALSQGTVPTFGQINWQGCVESRSNNSSTPQYDITDDTPSTKKFKAYYWPSDSSNNWYSSSDSTTCTGSGSRKVCTTKTNTVYNYSGGHGPNYECPQVITPMVAEKDTVLTAVNAMTALGNTHIDLGLAWAWRMLSPKWRGLWGGEMDSTGNPDFPQLPLNYNTPLMNKVVILMTDGDNTITSGLYSAYGYPTSNQLGTNECTSGGNCNNAITQLNTRTATVCTNMKAQGILIYTIALGTNISSTGKTLLRNCATNASYAFLSPTTNDLQTAFQQIGDSLANLRVSQ